MDSTPFHIDEFGTIRFTLHQEDGHSYEFEQEEDANFLFITLKNPQGRALTKRVIDLRKPENKDIIELYNEYIREQNEDDEGKKDSDDG